MAKSRYSDDLIRTQCLPALGSSVLVSISSRLSLCDSPWQALGLHHLSSVSSCPIFLAEFSGLAGWLSLSHGQSVTPCPHWNYNHGQGNVGSLTNQVGTWPKWASLATPQPLEGMVTVADTVIALSSPLDPSPFSGCSLNFQLFTPASLCLRAFSDHQSPPVTFKTR